MKKQLLKLTGLLLALICALPALAHDFEVDNADGNTIYYTILSDNEVAVTYRGDSYDSFEDEYSGKIDIPAEVTYEGTTYSVTSIGNIAFAFCTGLTEVTIPNSVTTIGYSAFYECTGLTFATIPNGISSINRAVFYNCSRLTSMTIPDSVTTIASYAFRGCSGLTEVTIGNSVTEIGAYAFCFCSGLTEVTIPESMKHIYYNAFYDCTGLKTVNLNATECIYMGAYDYDNENDTYTYSPAFSGCSSLSTINIGENVTRIPYLAFYGCTGVTEVTIPNSVTVIGMQAFMGCTGLTQLTIPNSVTSIYDSAFEGCSGLTTVNFNAINCTEMGSSSAPVFSKCTNLTTLNLGAEVTKIPANAFCSVTGLAEVTIPESVTSIGDHAFEGCTGLTTVNFNAINCTEMGSSSAPVFSKCTNLTTLNLGDEVTKISEYAFKDCTGLTEVSIPNSVTSIGSSAFSGCTGLTEVTIPNSVTAIGNAAFYSCYHLSEIIIPESVTSIGNSAFNCCTGLTEVIIGNSVTSIGKFAFCDCTGLPEITIPNSVTTIGSYAFRGCNGLKKCAYPSTISNPFGDGFAVAYPSDAIIDENGFIYNKEQTALYYVPLNFSGEYIMPNSVTTIGYGAFSVCTGLTEVTIPNSVTGIGNNAFNGCTGLTEVIFSEGLSEIGSQAFYNCYSLQSAFLPSTLTSCAANAFENCSGLLKACFPKNIDSPFQSCGSNQVYTVYYSPSNGFVENGWFWSKDKTGFIAPPSLEGYFKVPDNVRTLDTFAFTNCKNLKGVILPNSVTRIGNQAFAYCSSLENLVALNDTELTLGEDLFRNCNAGAKVFGPDAALNYNDNFVLIDTKPDFEVDGISYKVVSVPERTCKAILGNNIPTDGAESLIVPSTVEYRGREFKVMEIDNGAFIFHDFVKEVTIPGSVETVGEDAFYKCSVEKLTLANSENALTLNSQSFDKGVNVLYVGRNISDWAQLRNGENLAEVTLSELVTEVGDHAFDGCSGLQTIKSYNTVPPVMTEAVGFSNDNYFDTHVYVPDTALDAYTHADVWKGFWYIDSLETSGVETVATEENVDSLLDVYNLQGVCVKRNASAMDVKSLPAGIYIVGGKKVKI